MGRGQRRLIHPSDAMIRFHVRCLHCFSAGMQGHRFLAKSAEQGGYYRIKTESGALSCGMARVCDGLFKNYRWPSFMPFTPL